MYKIVLFLILLAAVILTSCQKEYSCEGCINGNKPPIALAGPDQVIILPTDSILLDGTSSNDPDGTIKAWNWKKVLGPAAFTINHAAIPKTVVKNLGKGIYQFELMVTDDKGLSATDTVEVTVVDPGQPNRPPIANAGPDQTITLPANSITLDGRSSSDPDNNITAYVWTKVSGPSSSNIVNANAVQTQANNFVQGTYQFELKVTDAGGLFSKDTVQIQVAANQPPVSQPPPPVCTGCRIVFVSTRDGNPEIYSCNGDGSNIQRLTNNAGADDQPAWSPDGTQIAFISDRTGNPEVYIMNADGSNPVRKTFSESYSQHPTWSPDGTKIAYSTLSNRSRNIWVVGATVGLPFLLLEKPGFDDHPTWSPDGTRIALVSDWAAYDFVYDIYTINADGTGFTVLTGNIIDNIDYVSPSWSPGGAKLAMAVSHPIGSDEFKTEVGIMNPDGSGFTLIRSDAATWTRTSWSGDGTRIAYTSWSGSRMDVSWVSADGSSGGTIVTNGWNADWQH